MDQMDQDRILDMLAKVLKIGRNHQVVVIEGLAVPGLA